MEKTCILCTALLLAVITAPVTQGAVTIAFDEVGADVVVTYSGSVNLASLDNIEPLAGGVLHGYDGDAAYIQNTGAGTYTVGVTTFFASPSFVTPAGGSPQTTISFTGDDFGLVATNLKQVYLPAAYVSGAPISGSMTFAGATIASLGLNPGSYVWQWTSGSVGDSATITVVPEPASFTLVSLGGLALLRRRR